MRALAAFDLDGTLVDTPAAIVEVLSRTLVLAGAPVTDTSEIRATIGLPLDQALRKLMGEAADDARVARAVRRYQQQFRETVLPRARALVYPGVEQGLAALRARGFVLGVATSKVSASAETLLAAAGLRGWFDAVVGADQVTRPKPSPDTAQALLRRCGVPAERACMVGDTTHDVRMARAAGMRAIAVTYGVHGAAELGEAEPTSIADTFGDAVALVLQHAGERAAPPAQER